MEAAQAALSGGISVVSFFSVFAVFLLLVYEMGNLFWVLTCMSLGVWSPVRRNSFTSCLPKIVYFMLDITN